MKRRPDFAVTKIVTSWPSTSGLAAPSDINEGKLQSVIQSMLKHLEKLYKEPNRLKATKCEAFINKTQKAQRRSTEA